MKTENGQARLERGEIAFPCTYVGSEICQGNRKSDNSPYNFSKHRCYVHLKTLQGQDYNRFVEANFDSNYNPAVAIGEQCYAVFGIKGDPTRVPSLVAFVPMPKQSVAQTQAPVAQTPVAPAPTPTADEERAPNMDDIVSTSEPTPFGE